MVAKSTISIDLGFIQENLELQLHSKRANTLFDAEDLYANHNEAQYQLLEGCFYDYDLSDSDYYLGDLGEGVVLAHSHLKHTGTIAPNIFVGTLEIPLYRNGNSEKPVHTLELEVQSIKSGYRGDYRRMLEFITEKCTDLLLQANSPVSHHFDIDYTKDSQSLYQKFAFIKSVIGTEEFDEAIHRIVTYPVTKWDEVSETKDIRSVKRFSNQNIKDLLKGTNRTSLRKNHPLKKIGIHSTPAKISISSKTDSVDTHENRFVKHALANFLKFCTDVQKRANDKSKLFKESDILIRELESHLHHGIFNQISRPTNLKLNSPVLQRKEGYREVLRVWLMFELAAKLIWQGGEDVYKGGKKDVAVLYEYWLFFKLLELLNDLFLIEPESISDLIENTSDGLNLRLKQGKFIPLKGIYVSDGRNFNVQFSYNKSFSGESSYPDAGSWTTTMRPDYTLTIWPSGISERKAEEEELIVHIHFDAKYKVANLKDYISTDQNHDLNKEKIENRKGIYKNADLLKMHAYKDAIRRTGGAYVLYPGGESIQEKGFHEIIPGLGAFAVKPSKTNTGIPNLKKFIQEVIDHFLNRTSQREKLAHKTYRIHKESPNPEDFLREVLPEPYGDNRDLIPDETFVLVGYCKSPEHEAWIKKNALYNFRMGTNRGSLIISSEVVGAKYLLLHMKGEEVSGNLWKIKSKGPKVFSSVELEDKEYPSPTQENYLVIEIERVSEPEFENVQWKFKKLKDYNGKRASAIPFTASLAELMRNKAE
ncbi:MAG: DUF2357 domain-containing protein [Bacteroidota bacterium]